MKNKILLLLFALMLIGCFLIKKKPTIIKTKQNSITFTEPFVKNGELVEHTYYKLQYSEPHEQAYWVAYKLTPEFLKGNTKRSNRFKSDPLIATKSASLKDYKHSGYDRGHLAPAGSMTINSIAMNESFYMSNMSPQEASFNRGIWKKLESQVRTWSYDSDSLFVVTGPVLKNIEKSIGANKVSVPKQFYKVLLRFKDSTVSSIGFLLDNTASTATLRSKAVAIDEIEEISGVDFNAGLSEALQNKIEGNLYLSDWEF
ncbi:DNA/RNA non-specific endonuclease [Bacteroidota bacterium]